MTLDLQAAKEAWAGLDAACSGLLASQCKRHASYMGCAMDCTDVANALVPEFATAAAIIPACIAEVERLRAECERLRNAEQLADWLDKLLVCYRVNRRPSALMLNEIDRLRATLQRRAGEP